MNTINTIVYFNNFDFMNDFKENKIDVPINTPIVLILDIEDIKNKEKELEIISLYNFRHPIVIDGNRLRKWIKKKKIFLGEKLKKKPYLCLYNQYDQKYKDYHFSFSNNKSDNNLRSIYFSLENYGKKDKLCKTKLIIDQQAIHYLEKYTKKHKFKLKNGDIEQREISGIFQLEPISIDTVRVSINEKGTNIGENENVGYKETIGSFHTHPLDAYIKYNVCLAFPSADDFATTLYIYAKKYGIFHITSTIEGLYIITMKKSFIIKVKRDKILKHYDKYEKDVMENYGIDYPSCKKYNKENKKEWKKDIDDFLKKINRKKYFNVQFVEWKDSYNNKPIIIHYKKFNDNCIFSDDQVRLDQGLYS